MTIAEKIQHHIRKLPDAFQTEVLDFVEYLLVKAEKEAASEDEDWPGLSLALAMRGLEDEAQPVYTRADLKIIFA